MKFYITSGKTMIEYHTTEDAMKAFYDTREIDPLATLWLKDGDNLYIYKPADGCFLPFPQD